MLVGGAANSQTNICSSIGSFENSEKVSWLMFGLSYRQTDNTKIDKD